jgi:ATP-dependent RNA helicase DHX37/DHR1
VGGPVGYQVRFDTANVGPHTHIKYMTDGILLREISHHLLLPQYSVIVLDEAHERNVNTDVLLGMLSRSGPVMRCNSTLS